jgi:hypothetical protein
MFARVAGGWQWRRVIFVSPLPLTDGCAKIKGSRLGGLLLPMRLAAFFCKPSVDHPTRAKGHKKGVSLF